MDIPGTFRDIAPFLQHPLVLVGFVILLFFGILTALLKAGILPQLPQKTAGDIVKRAINFGFIIALLIITLGFWEHFNDRDGKDGRDGTGTRSDTTHPHTRDTSVIAHQGADRKDLPAKKVYCRVTLLFPSEYNDAEILVDGRLADIIERRLNSVIIRMLKSGKVQKIVLRNNGGECTTREIVDGDRELRLCL